MAIKDDVRVLQAQVTELQRQARGIPRASRRVETLSREVRRLAGRVEALGENPASMVQVEAISQEFSRLTVTVQDHYRDLAGQLAALSEAHGDLDRRVADVEGNPALDIDFGASRVEIAHDATMDVETPWVEAFIFGIVAAAATAFFLNFWVAQDWEAGRDWAASIIIGVAAFWIMASFERLRLNLNLSGHLVWANRQAEEVPEVVALEAMIDGLPPAPERPTEVNPRVPVQ